MTYSPPPPRTAISDNYPNPSNGVARIGFGTLWDYVTGLLGPTGNPVEAQAALDVPGLSNTNTFTALQSFVGSQTSLAAFFENIKESATVLAAVATGTVAYDLTNQSVLYYTSAATANFTVNFRASNTATLDSTMNNGESVSASFLVTNGVTPFYNSAVTIDGNSVIPKWQGGSAPTSGNANGIDVYNYVIIKTAPATFTVLASQTKFA